nr:uncharacterized protein LOC126054418 [Helicoverpa armigera]
MIRNCLGVIIILALTTIPVTPVEIEKRIEGLKQEIFHKIEDERKEAAKETTKTAQNKKRHPDYYDYMVPQEDNGLIKPIIHHEHKKKHHKHKSFTSNLTATVTSNLTATTPMIKKIKQVKKIHNLTERIMPKNSSKVTPAKNFFRRFYLDEEERNKPQKWTHCIDLVTPRLKGIKDDWKLKLVTSNDPDIKRLSHLLSLNTSEYTKEEIVSVLYQISNIHLRLFQWDYTALTTIFNVIIPGSIHSFGTLKRAIKELFIKWHLDTNMLDVFLKQARIFRPPCIDISEYGGSTKTTGGVRWSKNTPKKDSDDEDCDD